VKNTEKKNVATDICLLTAACWPLVVRLELIICCTYSALRRRLSGGAIEKPVAMVRIRNNFRLLCYDYLLFFIFSAIRPVLGAWYWVFWPIASFLASL